MAPDALTPSDHVALISRLCRRVDAADHVALIVVVSTNAGGAPPRHMDHFQPHCDATRINIMMAPDPASFREYSQMVFRNYNVMQGAYVIAIVNLPVCVYVLSKGDREH